MFGQNLATPVAGASAPKREEHVQRRGSCPGLSTPMPTGDGWLVRLLPIGTIGLDAFAALCDAAQAHGNGVIEVTGRGSIQVRGLTPNSAPRFAAAIGALEIAAADGIPVLSNALAGLDPEEMLDASALARDLRAALVRGSLGASVSPKVSVAIDGGGRLSLDEIAADVRLRAEMSEGRAALHVSVAGDGASAVEIGSSLRAWVELPSASSTLLRGVAAMRARARCSPRKVSHRFVPPSPAPAASASFLPPQEKENGARLLARIGCATARWHTASGSPSVTPMRPRSGD